MNVREIQEEIRKSGGNVAPSPGDVHVNRPLTNISIAWLQDAMGFVCDRVFRQIRSGKQGDLYYEFDRAEWNRDDMELRAPGTESAGSGYSVSTSPFFCDVYGLHKDIPDQVRANADMPLSPDREATEFLTQKSMIQKEVKWATEFLKDSVWTFSADGNASRSTTLDFKSDANNNIVYWSDSASTPIEDVRAMKRAVQLETSFRPNVLTLSRPVYDVLIEHDDIIGRLNRGQTSGIAMANREDLARLFELEDVLVMDAIYNTAKLGATAAHTFIGGKNGLLSYRPMRAGLMTPSAGYTFVWRNLLGSQGSGGRIKRFRMEQLAGDRVEIESAYDFKLVAPDLGLFLDDVIR